MPLTNLTPRKPGFLCSICLLRLPSHDQWREHLITRATEDLKIVHCLQDTVNATETSSSFMNAVITESDDDREWLEDPSDLIKEPDLESGKAIRKKRLLP